MDPCIGSISKAVDTIVCASQYYCMHGCSAGTMYISGADPGFWERGGLINIFTTGGGYGRGHATSRDSMGSGAKPQPLFCFCVYLA